MSVFESPPGPRSKRSSVKSEDKHLEQIKTQANQILENEENSKQNNDQADDSKAPLVLQENPNMPDDEIIPNPNIYQDGDEESHKSEDNSIIGSKSSGSNLERKKKSKENSGEAEVKVSSNKFWLIRQILAYISWTRVYQIIDLLFVLYNMIFIPLQAAYRIEYSAAFITMEIFTIMVYSFDIYMLFLQHKN